jgi:hypothetical protein
MKMAEQYAGRRGKCRTCGAIVTVPQPATPEEEVVLEEEVVAAEADDPADYSGQAASIPVARAAHAPTPPTLPARGPAPAAPPVAVPRPARRRSNPLPWMIGGGAAFVAAVAGALWMAHSHRAAKTDADAPKAVLLSSPDGLPAQAAQTDRRLAAVESAMPAVTLPRRKREAPAADSEITLADTPDDVCEGGAGRYLLLSFLNRKEIAVFDAHRRQIVKTLPVESSDFVCAAGAEKMAVVLVDQGLVQRWDLNTFALEGSAPLVDGSTAESTARPKRRPDRGRGGAVGGQRFGRSRSSAAAMGTASAGPLLVTLGTQEGRSEASLFDLEALKPLPLEFPSHDMDQNSGRSRLGWGFLMGPMALRAASDGQTFGAWGTRVTPAGIYIMRLAGGRILDDLHLHDDAAYISPASDGSQIVTGRGVYTANGQPMPDDPSQLGSPQALSYEQHRMQQNRGMNSVGTQPVLFLPAQRSPWLVGVWPESAGPVRGARGQRPRNPASNLPTRHTVEGVAVDTVMPVSLTLGMRPGPGPIHLPATPEISSATFLSDELWIDQRIHWFMDENLIVTIPEATERPFENPEHSGDALGNPRHPQVNVRPGKLVLHGFDFEQALSASGEDYLFLDATPTSFARRGKASEWALFAASNNDPVRCTLQSGPPGMRLDDAGKLRWDVPANFDEQRVGIVLMLSDAAGKSITRGIALDVR